MYVGLVGCGWPQPRPDSAMHPQEKRRRQAEVESRRRQLEDDRRQLQHLKVLSGWLGGEGPGPPLGGGEGPGPPLGGRGAWAPAGGGQDPGTDRASPLMGLGVREGGADPTPSLTGALSPQSKALRERWLLGEASPESEGDEDLRTQMRDDERKARLLEESISRWEGAEGAPALTGVSAGLGVLRAAQLGLGGADPRLLATLAGVRGAGGRADPGGRELTAAASLGPSWRQPSRRVFPGSVLAAAPAGSLWGGEAEQPPPRDWDKRRGVSRQAEAQLQGGRVTVEGSDGHNSKCPLGQRRPGAPAPRPGQEGPGGCEAPTVKTRDPGLASEPVSRPMNCHQGQSGGLGWTRDPDRRAQTGRLRTDRAEGQSCRGLLAAGGWARWAPPQQERVDGCSCGWECTGGPGSPPG